MMPTDSHAPGALRAVFLGRMVYGCALQWQLEFLRWRRDGRIGDAVLFVEHDPVVTVGRASEDADRVPREMLAAHGIALHESARGGRATYHGPGQLVGYPIVHLRGRSDPPDLHKYLADLERALVIGLAHLGVTAHTRPGLRGVWVEDRKIASIGVAARGWVTYHGFALNVCNDLSPFALITPCGLVGVEMTSVERESPGRGDMQAASAAILLGLGEVFGVPRKL
jgi:lipoate-protein ligase B